MAACSELCRWKWKHLDEARIDGQRRRVSSKQNWNKIEMTEQASVTKWSHNVSGNKNLICNVPILVEHLGTFRLAWMLSYSINTSVKPANIDIVPNEQTALQRLGLYSTSVNISSVNLNPLLHEKIFELFTRR